MASASPPTPPLAASMLMMVNRDRQRANLPPLRTGSRLAGIALAHSLDMAQHDYLAHVTPQGASPFDRMARAGIHYRIAGENIGFESGMSPLQMLQRINEAMLRSPGHRANLLRSTFTRIGIGVVLIGHRLYVTEDFKH